MVSARHLLIARFWTRWAYLRIKWDLVDGPDLMVHLFLKLHEDTYASPAPLKPTCRP